MVATASPFDHLQKRSTELLNKFIEPTIQAEALAMQEGSPFPDPNFDLFAAFRMLSHAELEGYFEKKAMLALEKLELDFKSNVVLSKNFASLIFLHLWVQNRLPEWSADKGDQIVFKKMAQDALGFGRQFIKTNNGIKEASIIILSALMGFFADELDNILLNELNQYGKLRGDVAHDSWAHNTKTFESADIEKKRLERILELTKNFYEKE